jgi:hypothetical protein
MALFTTAKLASLAEGTTYANERYAFARKSADQILLEESRQRPRVFDIFLSHSFKDAQLILVVKRGLEGLGFNISFESLDHSLSVNRRQIVFAVLVFQFTGPGVNV